MTNKEYYQDKIIEIVTNFQQPTVTEDGEFTICEKIDCSDCRFLKCNSTEFKEWLEEEYEPYVDWTKVEVDTKILVRDFEGRRWEKRYFAYYIDSKVHTWDSGSTSWSCANGIAGATSWKYARLAEENEE